ncbi:hypothetical protein BDZ91DRAFT_720201 [Kalaharituber pfeilii]|nr:hypothetical protein BDZ91DRAFT_720201 [Kalaharituber pfeilii]
MYWAANDSYNERIPYQASFYRFLFLVFVFHFSVLDFTSFHFILVLFFCVCKSL